MKRVALLLGCALLLLPASPALAKKKHKPKKLGPVVTATATGNTVSSLGNVSTATATCPSGKQAVGGGFSVPLTSAKSLFVTSSFRSAPNAWTIAARDVDGLGVRRPPSSTVAMRTIRSSTSPPTGTSRAAAARSGPQAPRARPERG